MVNKFCPKCNQMVSTKNADINIFLLIVLGIFTGGLGALIYLLICFNQEQNRCINCNSICRDNTNSSINSKKEKNEYPLQNEKEYLSKSIRINYCPNCGNKIAKSNYENPNFCLYCGEALQVKYQIRSKQCTICHIHINAGDKTVQCSYCGSKYHYSCVAEWLTSYNSCPMCQNQFIIPKAQLLNK